MTIGNIINRIINIFLVCQGKLGCQKFYENLLLQSLHGLNIGTGSKVEDSGESYALRYIHKKLIIDQKENLIIFDVGANIGDYAKTILETFKKQRIKLFLFEPSQKTFSELKKNIKETDYIKFENVGLGNTIEDKTLYSSSNKDLSGLSSLYKRDFSNKQNLELNQTEDVKIDTLDNFCQRNNINKIDFMKMDVEGNELNVLQGSTRMLKNIKYIQFEFGGCNIDSRTFFKDFYNLLTNNGFVIYRIMQNGLFEIKKYNEIHEIFITSNFLAEHKS